MPETRLKSADTTISDDHTSIKFDAYGPPGEDGKQSVRDSVEVTVTELPAKMQSYLACRGLAVVCAGQYVRTNADPIATVNALVAEMRAGAWTPGRTGNAEPSPFHEALAVLSGVPVHVVERDIEDNKTKWTKSYVRQVRLDPRVAAKVAEIVEERAKRAGKAAKDAAKTAKPTLNLGGLFDAPAEQAAAAQ